MLLLLMLLMPFFTELAAQDTTTTRTTTAEGTAAAQGPAPETETTTGVETDTAASTNPARRPSSYDIRERFSSILRNEVPPEVAMIVKLEPALLSNEAYVANYPTLKEFLDANPEVRRMPQFYLQEFSTPRMYQPRSAAGEFIEALAVLGGFSLGLIAFIWIIRTIIEQRRWNRMSKTQTEVHNKILDRFGSSEELLQYIKSDAGTKFLESAPLPVYTERAPSQQHQPMVRVMRSVQWGIVTMAAGLGLFLVSLRFPSDGGTELFALGVILFFVGGGFIASAIVSAIMSRRLGLWQDDRQPNSDAGFVK
jgi:hypothetical protein